MIEALFFYVFSTVLVLSAMMVISAKNPVHAVLYLILSFFNAAGLFVMLGAELIAMILVIVYVGAVAVLFLFVVMMLDIDFTRLRDEAQKHAMVGAITGGVLLGELAWVYSQWMGARDALARAAQTAPQATKGLTNAHALGQLLYTHYAYLFQVSGLILLVAMIGAITLTLRSRPGVRKQVISHQLDRNPADVVKIEKIETGAGVS
ncbi:MAG: NADH-quinone oxidoreductase subunit J [Alphaproteobacteria bacterium]|nr:NADH-quinone oxidoreductase subunit J [Alphaproteobacteria bacterium]